jgi:hypothetical protein
MPYILVLFGQYFVGSLILRALTAMGIGYTAYLTADVAIQFFMDEAQYLLDGLPADLVQVAAIVGVQDFLSIVSAGFVTAIGISIATGALKRIAFK